MRNNFSIFFRLILSDSASWSLASFGRYGSALKLSLRISSWLSCLLLIPKIWHIYDSEKFSLVPAGTYMCTGYGVIFNSLKYAQWKYSTMDILGKINHYLEKFNCIRKFTLTKITCLKTQEGSKVPYFLEYMPSRYIPVFPLRRFWTCFERIEADFSSSTSSVGARVRGQIGTTIVNCDLIKCVLSKVDWWIIAI